MNQIEEFNNYYIQQSKEEDNQIFFEEPKEEEYIEENNSNIINNEEKKNIDKSLKIKESTSKRLSSLPKKYQTYKMDYKKQLVEEVIILIY